MLPPLPRCSRWGTPRSNLPHPYQPPRFHCRVGLHIVLFEVCSAFTHVAACTLALSPIRDTLIEGFSHFVSSMTAPIASGWSESPGGPCTHWKAPPCHGARRLRPFPRKRGPARLTPSGSFPVGYRKIQVGSGQRRSCRPMRHADQPRPSEYRSRTSGSYPSAPPARHAERCPETPAAFRSRSKNRRARRLIARTPPVPPLRRRRPIPLYGR